MAMLEIPWQALQTSSVRGQPPRLRGHVKGQPGLFCSTLAQFAQMVPSAAISVFETLIKE